MCQSYDLALKRLNSMRIDDIRKLSDKLKSCQSLEQVTAIADKIKHLTSSRYFKEKNLVE